MIVVGVVVSVAVDTDDLRTRGESAAYPGAETDALRAVGDGTATAVAVGIMGSSSTDRTERSWVDPTCDNTAEALKRRWELMEGHRCNVGLGGSTMSAACDERELGVTDALRPRVDGRLETEVRFATELLRPRPPLGRCEDDREGATEELRPLLCDERRCPLPPLELVARLLPSILLVELLRRRLPRRLLRPLLTLPSPLQLESVLRTPLMRLLRWDDDGLLLLLPVLLLEDIKSRDTSKMLPSVALARRFRLSRKA